MRILILAVSLFASAAGAAPEIGKPAPAFSLPGSDGKTHALADYKGKYVVLEWTNHECPFVKKHYGAGNMQAQQKALTRKGAVWLSIVSSAPGKQGHIDAAKANELTQSRGASPTAVLFDPSGEVGHAYGAKTTPHMFLIDPSGNLIYMGSIDSIASADPDDIGDAKQFLKVAFTEASSGKPVSLATSVPYGCSIKYP